MLAASTNSFQFNAISRSASQCTVRNLSTNFREDYDDWYSHGCTGCQTQYNEGIFFYGESNSHNDTVTYGVQPISELPVENIEYDLEDQDVDFSDEDFESLFSVSSSNDDTIVSAENMEYYPNTDESKRH
ncbi:unnamed protein product [Cylindrotheca closterium]|uniref:Uncharacterized protein n=1 Tax=Cylindrotheca closterium TaxID=2856 RepID=A0AAD2G0E1_9STRA|nr:unnamed protein product [Cylindrotheca closterium]